MALDKDTSSDSWTAVEFTSSTVVPQTNNSQYVLPFQGGQNFDGFQIGLASLNILYSWPNISSAYGNDQFAYTWVDGTTWPVSLPSPSFLSIADINQNLILAMISHNHYIISNQQFIYLLDIMSNQALYSNQVDSYNFLTLAAAQSSLNLTSAPTYPVEAFAITSSSWAAGIATLVIGGMNSYVMPGSLMTVAGNSVGGYNGTAKLVTAVSSTSVSYKLAADPGASGTGGTITSTWSLGTNTGVAITASSWSANVATISAMNVDVRAVPGSLITISGATPTAYNGTFAVSTVTSTTVTFRLVLNSNPGTGSSGTLTTLNFISPTIAVPVQAGVIAGSAVPNPPQGSNYFNTLTFASVLGMDPTVVPYYNSNVSTTYAYFPTLGTVTGAPTTISKLSSPNPVFTPEITPVQALEVTCNMVDNRISTIRNSIFSFTSGSTAYSLNVEVLPPYLIWYDIPPGTYNSVNLTFLDQNGRPMQILDPLTTAKILFRKRPVTLQVIQKPLQQTIDWDQEQAQRRAQSASSSSQQQQQQQAQQQEGSGMGMRGQPRHLFRAAPYPPQHYR